MSKNHQKPEVLVCCIKSSLRNQTLHLHPHAAIYWEETDTLIVADLHLGKATHFRRHGLAVPTYVQDETLEKLTGLLLDFKPARLLMLGDLFHSDYNPEWEDFAELVMAFSHVKFALVPGNHDRLTYHQYEKYNIQVHEEPYFEGPFAFSHHPLNHDIMLRAQREVPTATGLRAQREVSSSKELQAQREVSSSKELRAQREVPSSKGLQAQRDVPTSNGPKAQPRQNNKKNTEKNIEPQTLSPEPRTRNPEPKYNLAGHVHPAVMLQGRRDRLRLPCFYFGKEAGLLPAFGAFTGTYTIQPTKHDTVFVLTGNEVMRVG